LRRQLWHTSYDVRRGGDVAISQPLPYQLHLHALRDKERCAGAACTACIILPCSCCFPFGELFADSRTDRVATPQYHKRVGKSRKQIVKGLTVTRQPFISFDSLTNNSYFHQSK